jgi:hypothetical protein
MAVVDGGCPVLRPDSPCPDKPLAARITVTEPGPTDSASAAVVTTVDAGADGRFRVPLRPGRYLLRPANPTGARLPRADPVTVTVDPGRYTTVTIRFDSGIR